MARKTTAEKGYGAPHQRLRRAVAADVKAGRATCSRCGRAIVPGTRWHLDHSDDRATYLGPAHKRCNEEAGGRKGAFVKAARSRARRAIRTSEETTIRWLD